MNDTDWLQGVLGDLPHEPDRSLAIVAVAYLDDLLESGLRERLRDAKNTLQRHLDTFAAKTQIAKAIGYIDDDEFHDLELVRRIRNEFAHIPNQISFITPQITDRCHELKNGKMVPELVAALGFNDTPRQRFIWTVQILAFSLYGRWQTAERFQEPEPSSIPGGPPLKDQSGNEL